MINNDNDLIFNVFKSKFKESMVSRMKIFGLLLLLLFIIGCGNSSNTGEASTSFSNAVTITIKVGASPVPHAKILENIKEDLLAQGIVLEIVEFSDYVLPNLALSDGSINANYFQHQPYLDKMIQDRGLKIESIAKIHIEPLSLYSNKVKTIDEVKYGGEIAMPNDPSNTARGLILLHNNGLITLDDPTNLNVTELNIVDNPKNLKFRMLEAAMLPKVIDDVDGAIINGNYALQANLKTEDAILIEDGNSPYANVLVVRSSDVNNEEIKKLKEALLSDKTKTFIEENFKGEIMPAF